MITNMKRVCTMFIEHDEHNDALFDALQNCGFYIVRTNTENDGGKTYCVMTRVGVQPDTAIGNRYAEVDIPNDSAEENRLIYAAEEQDMEYIGKSLIDKKLVFRQINFKNVV